MDALKKAALRKEKGDKLNKLGTDPFTLKKNQKEWLR